MHVLYTTDIISNADNINFNSRGVFFSAFARKCIYTPQKIAQKRTLIYEIVSTKQNGAK